MHLDSTFCIDLMRERSRGDEGPALRKLTALADIPLHVSLFVLCELQAGARLSLHPTRELCRVESFAEGLQTVYPDAAFAVAFGEAEALLRRNGTPIPVMDLLIGIQAKVHGRPLLTRDAGHFRLIPGLAVESY